MVLTLTACVPFGKTKLGLPQLPGEYDQCFSKKVAQPSAGTITKKQVFALIAALKKSETAKSQCGKRLISFYEGLAKGTK